MKRNYLYIFFVLSFFYELYFGQHKKVNNILLITKLSIVMKWNEINKNTKIRIYQLQKAAQKVKKMN